MGSNQWTDILDKNAQTNILGEQEDQNKDEQEKETPATSSSEKEPSDESPASQGESEDKVSKGNTSDEVKEPPFHQHPRWKEVQEKNKKLSDIVERLAPLAEEFPKLREQLSNLSNQQPQLPQEFKQLFGDNPEAWKNYQAMQEQQLKQMEERIRASVRQEQEQAKSFEEKQLESIAEAVHNEVEEAMGVSLPRNSSEYNAFLKFVNDQVKANKAALYPDGNGGLKVNYGYSYETYQQQKEASTQPKVESRKKIAEKMGVTKAAPKETETDEYTMDNYPLFKRGSRR